MIAPRVEPHSLGALAIGLTPAESALVRNLLQPYKGKLDTSSNELDLWGQARSGRYDILLLGQGEAIANMNYLLWLLRGLVRDSRVILLFTTYTAEDEKHLREHPNVQVLTRPLQPEMLAEAIQSAFQAEERHESPLVSGLRRWLHPRRPRLSSFQ